MHIMARRATTTSAAAAKKTGAATSKKAAASKRNKGGETRGGGVGTSKAKAHNYSKAKENSKPPQSVVGSTRATRASKGKENGAVNATESKNTSGQKRRHPLGDISDRVHAESNVLSAKGKGRGACFKNSKSRKLNPDTVEKKNDFKKVRNVTENEKELLVDNISVEDRTADHDDDDEDASKIGEEEEFSESEDEAADSEHEEYHEETKASTKNNRKNSSKKKSAAASTKSSRVQRPVRGKSTPEETNGMAASAKTSKSTASSLKASKSRSSSRTVTTPTATARSSTRTRKNNQPTIYHDPSSSEGEDSDDEINDEESAYSNLENEHPNKRGKATHASKANTTDSTSATKTTITKSTPVPKEYQNVSGIVRKNTPKFEEELSYANGGMDWRCFGAIDY